MSRRTALGGGLGAAAVIGIVVYLVFFTATPPGSSALVSYCGGEGSAAHYHVLLVINDRGVQQHLPYDPAQSADIGFINQPGFTNPAYYCPAGGIHALHTHDGSGIIHLEIPGGISLNPAPTMGEFFTIWGEPLSPTSVWTFSGHVTAQVAYVGTGASTDYSADPASIPMPVPAAGPYSNPYPIPQSLIFGGAYGNGASSGTFAGEIVWLNVTA